MTDTPIKLTDPAAQAILDAKELTAYRADRLSDSTGLVGLHDADGFFVVAVTPGISGADLHALITVYFTRHADGYRDGRAAAFHQLRQLIGAAPAEGA